MGSIFEFLLFWSSPVLTRVDATKDDGAQHTASRWSSAERGLHAGLGWVPVCVFAVMHVLKARDIYLNG